MRNRIANLAVMVLEKMGALTKEECRAFGGEGSLRRIRICRKWRWHTDSHAYEWTDASGW
jgi:hypothetical protein